VSIAFGPPELPQIHLLLAVPNERKGPAAVFLGMNFCGNHALVKDSAVRLPTGWIDGRGPDTPGRSGTISP
jgi:hypothetical protein